MNGDRHLKLGKRCWILAFGIALVAGPLAHLRARDFPVQATVLKIEVLKHNVKRIKFKAKSEDFTFKPGQKIRLELPEDYLAEFNKRHKTSHEEVYRPYSFALNPSDRPSFDLIIKHYDTPRGKDVPAGVASTYVHKHPKVGDVVSFSNPGGRLYARNDSERPIVVLAGDVGIVPFVCLLGHWFENRINDRRKIYLFLGGRSR